MKKLAYIVLMILLATANAVAQESYVIDIVCQDAERTYRIDGEKGSTWLWKLHDADSTQIALANETGFDFAETDAGGDSIWGSEIEITWAVDTGTYFLSVEQTSSFGCINHELGEVEVVPDPEAFAGNPIVACATGNVFLREATAANYSELIWTTFGDGTFSDPNAVRPTYFPGEGDLAAGSVTLSLMAVGLGNSGTCEPALSTIDISFIEIFAEITPFFAEVCEGTPIQLNGNPSDNSQASFTHEWSAEPEEIVWLSATNIVDPVFSENAPPGTYIFTYTVTNEYGCEATDRVVITVNKKPLLVITNPEPVCEPEAIDLTAAAVTAGSDTDIELTYWLDQAATQPLTRPDSVVVSGTYYIRAVNSFGCFEIEAVNVIRESRPVLVITDPDPVCEPQTINLTEPAITAGSDDDILLSYWLDEDATQPLARPDSVSVTGIYFIRAENAGGCFVVEPVSVIIHEEPLLVITDPAPVCEPEAIDLTDLALTAGSDSDLQFSYWLDGEATEPLARPDSVIATGTYYIGATNSFGCFVIESINVTVHPRPVLVITDPEPVCEPEAIDLTVAAVTTGSDADIQLTYWLDADATQPLSRPDSVAVTGIYFIRAENTFGCFTIEPVNVVIDSQPLLVVTDPAPVCEPEAIDLTDASITAGSDADIHLTYWQDEAATQPLTRPDSLTATGTYYIRGTNLGGCFITREVNVTIYSRPLLVVTDPEPVCEPETVDLTDASVTVGSDSDILLSYWLDEEAIQPLNNPDAVTATGTYYIRAENSFGCFTIERVNVEIDSEPLLVITDPDPVCEPQTINLTEPPITAGSDDDILLSYWLDEDATQPLARPDSVSVTGIYFIRAENAGRCFVVEPVSVIIHEEPLLVITDPAPVCEPEAVDLTDVALTAGSDPDLQFSYWLDGDATQPLARPDSVIATGTYYIGATNSFGCFVIESINVTVHPRPVLVITDPEPVCEPEAIDLTVAAVTTGSDADIQLTYWLDADATQPLSRPDSVAVTGIYFIRAENTFGCFTIEPVNVVIDSQPLLVVTDPAPVCGPEAIDLTDASITAGSDADIHLTYWQDEAATQPLTRPDSLTATGTYYIRGTNLGGCFITREVNVTIYSRPLLVVTDPEPVCEPETVDLTDASVTVGSDSDILLSYWLDEEAIQPLNNPDAVTATGTYYIGAENSFGCFVVEEVHVIIGLGKFDIVYETACDSFIWLDGTGITYYNTGPYDLITINAAGCDDTLRLDLTIIESVEVSVLITADRTEVTEGEEVTFTATPVNEGTNPVYAWFVNDVLVPGESSVTFTYTPEDEDVVYATLLSDINCSGPKPAESNRIQITVTKESTVMTINHFIIPIECYGESTGGIELTVSGGTEPYTYLWNTGETTKDIYNLAAGTYTVTVTDDAGESQTHTVMLSQPTEINLVYTKEDVGYSTEPIGSISLTVSGGTGPYSYEWTGPDGFTSNNEDINGLWDGAYSVVVTDANGCQVSRVIIIEAETPNVTQVCPTDLALVCVGDEPPLYRSYQEFAGGLFESDCELVLNSFRGEEISRTGSCPTIIIRRYSIVDECGIEMECYQTIIIDDNVDPMFPLNPYPTFVECIDDVPPAFTNGRQGYNRFVARYGPATDSCGIDENSFRLVSQVIIDEECPKIQTIRRIYEIRDYCGNFARFNERIDVEDKTPPGITCPDDITAEATLSDLEMLTGLAFSAEEQDIPLSGALGLGILYSDNCEVISLTYRDVSDGNCPTTIERTYTVSDGCNETSCIQTITLTKELPVSVTIETDKKEICLGDLVVFTATPVNGGDDPVYAWFVNGVEMAGETASTFVYQPDDTVVVYATLTSSLGCVTNNPGTSNEVIVAVVDELEVSVSIEPDREEVCLGDSVAFTATPVNGGDDPVYAWFVNGVEMAGETASTFVYQPADTIVVYATLTSSLGCVTNNPATSNEVIVAVVDELEVSVSIEPDREEVCLGDSVTFTATPVNGGDDPVYAWFVNGEEITGKTDSTFVYAPSETIEVYATLTSSLGCAVNNPATSNTVIIRITDGLPVSVDLIPDQPEICEGDSVIFEAIAVNAGNNPQYRWFVNGNEIVEETGSTFVFEPKNGDEVFVELTSSETCVIDPIALSDTISVRVNKYRTPVFDPIGPICQFNMPPALPDTSLNGIHGTWNPDVIDTSVADTLWFVFTPDDTVRCAEPFEMAIVIDTLIIPQFDPIGPLCIGQMPPQLPKTDRNLIAGTWSEDTIDTSVAGNLMFVFTPDNSYECAETITISITVSENTPPVAMDDNTITLQNETVMIAVTDNDYDSNSEIDVTSVQIIDGPANGTAVVSPATGVVSYTPAFNFVGFDTLTYAVSDDGIPCEPLSDTALVIFEVKAPNNPPVALDDTFTVICYPLIEYVLYNDYDPDRDNIRIVTWPMVDVQHGTVTIESDGAFVYMPDEGFVGVDTFVYRIYDDGFPSMWDEATVYINILPSVDCDGLPGDDDEIPAECSLFIPDGFSPNGDNVHDFFQIYCIEKYPDAIMRIFDRAGNKLFEKRHYGNLDHWGSDDNAWWWGNSEHRLTLGRGTVPAGNYLYVLELGNGEVRTGTVMVAY